MSAIDIASVQNLVDSFSKLNSSVIWIRSGDNKSQVFVSKSVEQIYGFSSEQIYENPGVWANWIDKKYLGYVLSRAKERIENMKKGIRDYQPMYYEVILPNGQKNFVKNHCYPILAGKQLVGFYGFGETLDQHYWQMLKDGTRQDCEQLQQIGNDIVEKLTGDFKNRVDLESNGRPNKIVLEALTPSQKLMWKQLSPRERECFEQLVLGRSAKETARVLSLSYRTVEAYIASIKQKLNCHKKIQIISKFNNVMYG
jgi:DNA-binding CsgD family transcriptional regulator